MEKRHVRSGVLGGTSPPSVFVLAAQGQKGRSSDGGVPRERVTRDCPWKPLAAAFTLSHIGCSSVNTHGTCSRNSWPARVNRALRAVRPKSWAPSSSSSSLVSARASDHSAIIESAPDKLHALLGVAIALNRCFREDGIEFVDLVGSDFHIDSPHVLLEAMELGRTWNWHNPRFLCK